MNSVELRVYGFPVAQGRPRLTTVNGFARAYDPAKSRDWKRTVHHEASSKTGRSAKTRPRSSPLDAGGRAGEGGKT